jgi:hypothetical protein
VYLELTHKISWPSSCKSLVGKWGSAYQGSFYGKSVFQRTWKASSKFVCWHLWLARNKAIFKNKLLPPSFVATHAIRKMVEYLNTKRIRVENIQKLDPGEDIWMAKFNIQVIISTKISQRSFWQL